MSVVDIESAKREVNTWLDYKKVSESKRSNEKYSGSIDTLAEAISEGDLVLNSETFVFTQKLKFEIGSEQKIKQLEFKPRVDLGRVRKAMARMTSQGGDDRIACYISELTSQTMGVVDQIDTEDKGIAQAIAIFFL